MTMATNQQWAADGTGEFTIGSSRRLAAILTIGHAAVAALLLFLDFAALWKVAALALLFASLCFELRAALRLGANAVTMMRISADNIFSVKSRAGEWRECEVLGSTYVTAFLTVVNLRPAGKRRVRSIVILADSMTADDFRRLRVWLRWRPQKADR